MKEGGLRHKESVIIAHVNSLPAFAIDLIMRESARGGGGQRGGLSFFIIMYF